MNEKIEIDHEHTDEIVCPHCGYVYNDSCELGESGTEKCYECDKEFSYEQSISVSYSTNKETK